MRPAASTAYQTRGAGGGGSCGGGVGEGRRRGGWGWSTARRRPPPLAPPPTRIGRRPRWLCPHKGWGRGWRRPCWWGAGRRLVRGRARADVSSWLRAPADAGYGGLVAGVKRARLLGARGAGAGGWTWRPLLQPPTTLPCLRRPLYATPFRQQFPAGRDAPSTSRAAPHHRVPRRYPPAAAPTAHQQPSRPRQQPPHARHQPSPAAPRPHASPFPPFHAYARNLRPPPLPPPPAPPPLPFYPALYAKTTISSFTPSRTSSEWMRTKPASASASVYASRRYTMSEEKTRDPRSSSTLS